MMLKGGVTRLGTVLGGAYRLESMIGEGGMGTVFEASHLRLPRRFAIKLLNAEALANPDVFDRFKREAEIASSLGEDHIVQVFDFNHTDDGVPYMVLELLHGEDLSGRITARGRLSLAETASVVEQMSSALETAHAAGIVHRDLKPQNVFLCQHKTRDDFVKVLDFGISKVLDSPSLATKTGEVFGTPYYMSPEQAQGKQSEIDARTDIFALGAIIYECLSGQRAFNAGSIVAALYQVCHAEPEPLRAYAPEVPAAVQTVLARALAKRREDRYQSVGELCADFLQAAALPPAREVSGGHRLPSRGGPVYTPTPIPMAATTMSGATGQTFDSGVIPGRKRRTGLIAGLSLAVIAASVVVAVFALRGNKDDKPAPVASNDPPKTPKSPPPQTPVVNPTDRHPEMDDARREREALEAQEARAQADAEKAKADALAKDKAAKEALDAAQLRAQQDALKKGQQQADAIKAEQQKAAAKARADADAAKKAEAARKAKEIADRKAKELADKIAKEKADKGNHPDVTGEPAGPPGKLLVKVTNTWAEVIVDGKSVGNAPLTVTLSPGKHHVTVKNDDKSESFAVTIKSGALQSVDKTL